MTEHSTLAFFVPCYCLLQLAAAVLQETHDTLCRMYALEGISPTVDPLLLSPFRYGTAEEKQNFVHSISALVDKNDNVRKSKSKWIYKVLPGLQNEGKDAKDHVDIDPEMKFEYKTIDELNSK